MKIIVCAIFSEAKALIEKFDLKQTEKKPFLIYENDTISLIISGMGKINSAIATTYIAKDKKIESITNIGICASNDITKKIGSLCHIRSIVEAATGKKTVLNTEGEVLYTFDDVVQNKKDLKRDILIDMEGYGFYKASKNLTKKENIKIYKIISDHLDTFYITNDFIYELVKKCINESNLIF